MKFQVWLARTRSSTERQGELLLVHAVCARMKNVFDESARIVCRFSSSLVSFACAFQDILVRCKVQVSLDGVYVLHSIIAHTDSHPIGTLQYIRRTNGSTLLRGCVVTVRAVCVHSEVAVQFTGRRSCREAQSWQPRLQDVY